MFSRMPVSPATMLEPSELWMLWSWQTALPHRSTTTKQVVSSSCIAPRQWLPPCGRRPIVRRLVAPRVALGLTTSAARSGSMSFGPVPPRTAWKACRGIGTSSPVRIGHVSLPVGEGQLLGLDHQVDALGSVATQRLSGRTARRCSAPVATRGRWSWVGPRIPCGRGMWWRWAPPSGSGSRPYL